MALPLEDSSISTFSERIRIFQSCQYGVAAAAVSTRINRGGSHLDRATCETGTDEIYLLSLAFKALYRLQSKK